MPTISSFYGIVIRMYFDDHAPPHFHAVYQNRDAMIGIESLNFLEGEFATPSHGARARLGSVAPSGIDGQLAKDTGARCFEEH